MEPENQQNTTNQSDASDTLSTPAAEESSVMTQVAVASLVLLLIIGLMLYIYYGMTNTPASTQETPAGDESTEVGAEPTIEEKLEVLNALESDADPAEEQLTREEKLEVLNALESDADPAEEQLTREEKLEVLNSLQ